MSEFAGLEIVPLAERGSAGEGATRSASGREQGTCPDCGKTLTITAEGKLRSHKCIDEQAKTPARNKRTTPTSVRKLGIALVAGGAEWTAGAVVSRYVPCEAERARKAADLGANADVMVGPLIDLLWPAIPKGAQKAIKRIADETDLIVCAMAWAEWGHNLQTWAKAEHEKQLPKEAVGNGQVFGPTDPGRFGDLRIAPFEPDAASGPVM